MNYLLNQRYRRGLGSILPPCLALLMLLSASTVLGQGAFALTNIGPAVDSWDARVEGRGGWCMAETDTLLAGFMNPASLVQISGVTVLFNGIAETRVTTSPDNEREANRVAIPNIRLAVPIFDRAAFSAGFFVRRTTHYATMEERLWDLDGESIEWTEVFRREGTQYEVPLTLSLRLHPMVSGALGVSLFRGGMKETLSDGFGESGDGGEVIVPSIRVSEDEFSAVAGMISVLVEPTSWLSLGANWRPGWDVDVDREVSLEGVAARATSRTTWGMPDEYRFGAAADLTRRWRCGVDFGVKAFSQFSGRADWEESMLDEWTCSFGIERRHTWKRHGGLNNLPLRLGVSIRRWGYTVGGEEIIEKTISAGTGFAERSGCFDLALSYGRVGDLGLNGYEDSFWRLTVSIIDVEKWW